MVGAIISTDAAALRPIRDKAVWTYNGVSTPGSGANPVSYVTRTTQASASSGAATESFSNSSNAGTDTQALSIIGGIVGVPQSIDFAGKGIAEAVPFIEMRSPVRQGDQYTIWDRHYTDTNIDVDGDKKPDALDVAIYGRVIGLETLSLPGLPALGTVRVDITLRARITASSNGQVSPVVESVVQTWYARGIGIVRQRSSTPAASNNGVDVVDEQLSSWDGISEGFGAMAAQAMVVPMTGALSGPSPILGAAGFSDHALVVLSAPFTADSSIARLDLRGRLVSSRIQTNMPAGSEGLVVPHRNGLLYLRQVHGQSGLTSTVALTRFDADGALMGVVAGATIDLTGPRTNPMFDGVKAAVDGTTLWLIWPRIYNTPTAQERELILRPYTLDGVPLGPELQMDTIGSTAVRIAGLGGRVLVTWGRFGNGYEAVYASVAVGDAGVTVRTFAAGLPIVTTSTANQLLVPVAGGASGALLWGATLPDTPSGTTAGILLDTSQNPIRAGNSLANEVLAGVPALPDFASAIDGTPDGSLIAVSLGKTISWVTTSANSPLSAHSINQVSLLDTSVSQHVVLADRVLVLRADGDQLTSAVVWLNSGVAP